MTAVIDTSALMALLLDEKEANAVAAAIETGDSLFMSAANVAEALIVARRRGVGPEMSDLIEGAEAEIVPVTPAFARAVADAYEKWGKGVHPAGLNFGDCFSYALAREFACPLLYVGDDFARTDIESAIALKGA